MTNANIHIASSIKRRTASHVSYSIRVEHEELIAVILEKPFEMVTAILGTLKAAAALRPHRL